MFRFVFVSFLVLQSPKEKSNLMGVKILLNELSTEVKVPPTVT